MNFLFKLIYISIVSLSLASCGGGSSSNNHSENVDEIPPVISAPANITLSTQTLTGLEKSDPNIQVFLNSAVASDNIDNDEVATNNAPDTFPLGDTTVTFSHTDKAGNTASKKTSIVTIILKDDLILPIITAPDAIQLDSQSPKGISKSHQKIQMFLNAAVVTEHMGAEHIADNDAPDVFPIGDTIVKFTFTDGANNMAESVSSTVTIRKINDIVAPIIIQPVDISLTTLNSSGVDKFDAQIQSFLASAKTNDNVDPDSIAENNVPAVLSLGTTTITFTYQDAAGNNAKSVTAKITITNPVEDAFKTADISTLSIAQIQDYIGYERDNLVATCQANISDFYPSDDYYENEFFYDSSKSVYTSTAISENTPVQLGHNNQVYTWIGKQSNTGRYVFSGYDFLDRSLEYTAKDNNGIELPYQGLKQTTARIFIWALGAKNDSIFNENLTVVAINYDAKKDLAQWLETFYPDHGWSIIDNESDSSAYTSGNYDLFIEVFKNSNTTNNGVHKKALFNDNKPVIAYNYTSHTLQAEDLADFGLFSVGKKAPILNLGFPSEICTTYINSNMSSDPIITTINNLENNQAPIIKDGACANRQCDYTNNTNALMPDNSSAYQGFKQGVDKLFNHLNNLSNMGQDVLKAHDYYNIIKAAVLIGDKYRESIVYTNENGINRDTHPVEFHKAYFADFSTQLARGSHKKQENLGYYSEGASSEDLAAQQTATIKHTYTPRAVKPSEANNEWISSKVYLLPGVPMTITRTDNSSLSVDLRINMFRENRPIWRNDKHFYDGPQNIKSEVINLKANTPYTISSPLGGALYLNYTYNNTVIPIEITYQGAAQHAVLEANKDGSLFSLEQVTAFDNDFIQSPYAFADVILQNGVELHITKNRYLKTMKAENRTTPDSYSPEDVANWINSFDTFLINENYKQYGVLADFLPDHSQSIKDFCTKLDSLSTDSVSIYSLCEDPDINAIPKKQHINLEWNPRCGSSCSGNPLDSGETITIRKGYVISHELGHNLQTYRTKIYNKKSTEISTNIYPYRSLSRYYLTAGIEAVNYSRASVDFKSAYNLLQYYHNNGYSAKEHPWLTDDEQIILNGEKYEFEEFRRAFYLQFFFIHNSWDVFTKVIIIDRLISHLNAIGADEEWALYKTKLGFSNYASLDDILKMTGEDFMAISLSLVNDLDHSAYFAAWGVEVSFEAQQQIKANQQLADAEELLLPLNLYKVPDTIIDGKVVESPIYGDMFNRVVKAENIRTIDGISAW